MAGIPEDDKKKIEKLFSYLFLDEGFAYTLLGSKPISTIGFDKTTPACYREMYPHPLFELEDWWHVWEKYSNLFPMKNFAIFFQNEGDWFEIYFVNKHFCLNEIRNNHKLFVIKLKESRRPIDILQKVISCPNVFRDGLNQSQALLGILLGYGKKNSVSFEKQWQKKSTYFYKQIQEEVIDIHDDKLLAPSFSSFSKKETSQLKKQYQKERDLINKYYLNNDFLEKTLEKLMS